MIQFSCARLCHVLRYAGQTDWFRANQRGKFSWDFLNHKDTALEEVDMSYTVINYTGLENLGAEPKLFYFSVSFKITPLHMTMTCVSQLMLMIFSLLIYCFWSDVSSSVGQQSLRTLSLRGCPEVDDWFLARLHVFQDSLEELDISYCPCITTGGLAALRNLK